MEHIMNNFFSTQDMAGIARQSNNVMHSVGSTNASLP